MNKWTSIFIGGFLGTIISLLIYWRIYIKYCINQSFIEYLFRWVFVPYYLFLGISMMSSEYIELDIIFEFITSWIFIIPIGMLIGYIVWKTRNRN